MDESMLTSILDRMTRLEEQNRHLAKQALMLKRLGGAVLLACIVTTSFAAASAVPDAVVLNDPVTGKRIIDMVTTNTGAAGFQVWDRNGQRRILLGTNDVHQPGLTMWDAQGKQRIMVGINNEGIAHATIWDQNGRVINR
jgi:hypothetical protein